MQIGRVMAIRRGFMILLMAIAFMGVQNAKCQVKPFEPLEILATEYSKNQGLIGEAFDKTFLLICKRVVQQYENLEQVFKWFRGTEVAQRIEGYRVRIEDQIIRTNSDFTSGTEKLAKACGYTDRFGLISDRQMLDDLEALKNAVHNLHVELIVLTTILRQVHQKLGHPSAQGYDAIVLYNVVKTRIHQCPLMPLFQTQPQRNSSCCIS